MVSPPPILHSLPQVAPPPMTPEEATAHGYRSIRYNANALEKDIGQARVSTTWGHSRPWSVYIAAIGHHWSPGSWQRVMDMMHYNNQKGYHTAIDEIQDRCKEPYDALGVMRNEAIMRACEGFEFLCYVDNDVLPEPEALYRLVQHDREITLPWVEEPGTGKPLHGPELKKWSGLQPARWGVLSMMVIKTAVFRATGPEFWNNAIGADEGYHFQKFWHYGFRPWIDTNCVVHTTKPPLYPLATNRMPKDEAEGIWDARRKWLLQPPDRRPIDPNDKRVVNGEYLPFAPPQGAPGNTDIELHMDGTMVQQTPTNPLSSTILAEIPAKPIQADPNLAAIAKLPV